MSDGYEWILRQFTRVSHPPPPPTWNGPTTKSPLHNITMLPPCHINVAHLQLRYYNIDPNDHLVACCS